MKKIYRKLIMFKKLIETYIIAHTNLELKTKYLYKNK